MKKNGGDGGREGGKGREYTIPSFSMLHAETLKAGYGPGDEANSCLHTNK